MPVAEPSRFNLAKPDYGNMNLEFQTPSGFLDDTTPVLDALKQRIAQTLQVSISTGFYSPEASAPVSIHRFMTGSLAEVAKPEIFKPTIVRTDVTTRLFEGRVDSIDDGFGYVTMREKGTEKRLSGRTSLSTLEENQIHEGDRFSLKITKYGGKVIVNLSPVALVNIPAPVVEMVQNRYRYLDEDDAGTP